MASLCPLVVEIGAAVCNETLYIIIIAAFYKTHFSSQIDKSQRGSEEFF